MNYRKDYTKALCSGCSKFVQKKKVSFQQLEKMTYFSPMFPSYFSLNNNLWHLVREYCISIITTKFKLITKAMQVQWGHNRGSVRISFVSDEIYLGYSAAIDEKLLDHLASWPPEAAIVRAEDIYSLLTVAGDWLK